MKTTGKSVFQWENSRIYKFIYDTTQNLLLFESIDPVMDPEGEKGTPPDGSDSEAEFFLFKAISSSVS